MSRELTVVVPSVNGWNDLAGCLEALERQRDDVDLEVLVIDRVGESVRTQVARLFPAARVVPVPTDTTIPLMRAAAFEAATKKQVAVIEDHVLVPRGWAARMIDALVTTGADAVGGAVMNAATGNVVERAAFLCEYHQLLPPLPAGDTTSIAGNNVVYRRATLEAHCAAWRAGRWENHLHDRITASGGRLVSRPDIIVAHKMHYGFGEYLSQRFLYSRSYAAARMMGAPPVRRLFYGGAAVGLPPLILARIVRSVWRKSDMRRELLASFPLLVPFTISWALGELAGYWFGAGDALARVR